MAKDIVVFGVESDAVTGVRIVSGSANGSRADACRFLFSDFLAEKPQNDAADENDGASAEEAVNPLEEALKAAKRHFKVNECALALPLARLLTTMTRVPVAEREDLTDEAVVALGKESPFPDEELLAGAEVAAETDRDLSVFTAALPEATGAEIGEALAAAKLCVTRTDVLALGWLRVLWPRLVGEKGLAGRKVALTFAGGCWDLAVVDDGAVSYVRGLGLPESAAAFGREVMLSLLAVPGGEPTELVIFAAERPSDETCERLAKFAPIRFEAIDDPAAGTEGCALREAEGSTFDVTPADWRQKLKDTRFRKKMFLATGIALGVWLLLMGVLFGVPFAYDRMTAHDVAICTKHASRFARVKETKSRVELVQKYSDHKRGALEMLRLVSEDLPEGITLTSFQYTRQKDMIVLGEAESDYKDAVYSFCDALRKCERFGDVALNGPQQIRQKGKSGWKFEIKAVFADEGDEAESTPVSATTGRTAKGGKGGK